MLVTCLACGHKNQVPPYYEATTCRECGKTIVQSLTPPEKKESKTKLSLPIRIAQIILRDDNGPTDARSTPESFIEFRPGKFIDLKFLDTVPAFHTSQLEFCDE